MNSGYNIKISGIISKRVHRVKNTHRGTLTNWWMFFLRENGGHFLKKDPQYKEKTDEGVTGSREHYIEVKVER